MPPVPKPDQSAPADVSATGVERRRRAGAPDPRAQGGDRLTSPQGLRIADTDHALKAGPRGPILLEDTHLREKVSHFDHERIPERVVHARGAAAHGVFTAYGSAAAITRAQVLAEKDLETPVFVRFSTVLGSRGAADTARDTRGFAVKFYTPEGNWDLVGNNMPVFFVQEAIKFPDLIHAAKPSPSREIPQGQSAHDSFWDFVSLHTEATHHVLWTMSDRGIPRSYRMMEGYGVHTFRLVNADRETVLVQFKWTPVLGVHSLTWEEAQIAAGVDPDFHRRDLADAIEAATVEGGGFPEWELGVQVFPDNEEQTYEGIDLLDPTKIVPEEMVPVQPIGKLVLTANPTNYFAETEQVAFNTGHVVPGIGFTNDPLLQGRNFSYQDTQLTRLGGPNWTQLPINRPQAPVNDNHRDGFLQQAVPTGEAAYLPNRIDGGGPLTSDAEHGGYVTVPRHVDGDVVRALSSSFDDHFSQAAMFYASLSDVEQTHTTEAYTFELGKVYERDVKERALLVLAKIDAELCAKVAEGLGLTVPDEKPVEHLPPSAALSQVKGESFPITGRQVGVLAGPGADLAGIAALRTALEARGAQVKVIAPHGGELGSGKNKQVVERTTVTARSIEFDAIVVAAGAPSDGDIKTVILLQEALRQLKPFAAWGDGVDVLAAAGIDTAGPGVLTARSATKTLTNDLVAALGRHRVWARADLVTASAVPPSA